MKEHHCPVEKALIAYEGECNWCGQKEWVGLTDEEIFETHKQVDSMQYLTFAKAIEAKLKELNT